MYKEYNKNIKNNREQNSRNIKEYEGRDDRNRTDNTRTVTKRFGEDKTRKNSTTYNSEESYVTSHDDKSEDKNIDQLKSGDFFDNTVKIVRKAKPGPVIFLITDGHGNIDAVTKESEFNEEDIVRVIGPVSERAGRLQIEISRIEKSNEDFIKKYEKIIDEKSMPKRIGFSIESKRYELMKKRFLEIAKRIRKAVFENQPIIIRHHNDSDGISAGLSIEMALKNVMERSGINHEYNLYRSPSKAPYYETGDVFRDIVMSNRLTNGHGQKKPLIIMLDNGSTPEDLFGFKTLKILEHEAIVIDHHNPVIIKDGKTTVCPYISYHLNPYLFGLDSQTSAGMMAYELARFIDEEFNNPIIPAVAAISDRCVIPETDSYIKNSGLSKDELTRIGIAIDFIAYHMKFDPGKGLFEELYKRPEFVEIINAEVKEGVETQLQSTLPYLKTQDVSGIIFSHIDLEKYTLRFTYPTPGKVLGMIHDTVAEGKEHMPVITIGYLSDMIIIRATKPVLPIQKIIEILQKDIPQANVDGGGHEMAGTIKFVPAHLDTIIEKIKEELKKIRFDRE